MVGRRSRLRSRFRRMAFTMPGARGFLQWARVRATDWSTAALWGMRVKNSIW